MGKSITESKHKDKDGETKVLFKKSNATMFSHSRTYSGASQSYSKSGILQIKKNLENNHNYYFDGGKLKRDLSVETDVCILRRHYRTKKNKMSIQDSSAKSRYSNLVDTEVETIEEFPDTSACGDNDTAESKSNPPLDIASLMIDNLKDLLNQWIQKHLIENKDTKQKIDTVLDSLIQKLDTRKTLGSSSGSTYVLHKEATSQEVKNKKVATASITCQYCKQRARNVKVGSSSNISQKGSSSLTIPFQYKDIRIISTLSIPRSFHKRGMDEKKDENSSCYKMKKIKHKNIILSIDRSNKLMDSSSFDLVAISTKSLTKKCINYDMNVKKKKRHIVFFPKPFYKSATDSSSTTNNENIKINNVEFNKHQLDDMPSLLKSLYANDPAIIVNIDKNIQYDTKNDNSTMTENKSEKIIIKSKGTTAIPTDIHKVNTSNPTVATIDYIDELPPSLKKSKSLDTNKTETIKTNILKNTLNRGKINKRKRILTNKMSPNFKAPRYQNIHNKQFTFLYKKANSHMSQGKDFLKHCQNILQYFAEYEGNKNIKLDVRVNVFPMYENRTKDVCTDISNQAFGIYDIKGSPTLLYNVQPTEIEVPIQMAEESIKDTTENDTSSCEFTPEIIPLLDGAVSQAKYIFSVTSREKMEINSKPNSLIERSTLTNELEIIQEISELRAVIKDLAAAAERFVNEQLKRESNKSNAETFISRNASNNFSSSSKCEAVINLRNPSKAIQYSKDFAERQKLVSGLKITKEPKKKETFEYYNRLAKKSTSYRIIDSESILKVTDMTSKANEFNEYRIADEALTCSLPKSRSLFELTSEQRNKRKLIALFCDGYSKNPQCRVCNMQRGHSLSSSTTCTKCKKWFPWKKENKKEFVNDSQSPGTLFGLQRSLSHSNDSCIIPMISETPDYGFSSTACFPQEEVCEEELTASEELRENVCKVRKGMGFGEGCVYCMLMWIPVIIIGCLFYGYVIRDNVTFPEERKVVGRQGNAGMDKQKQFEISMDTTKETVMKKEKRPKSATRYPKRMPTYVVAIAVQESYDDPAIHKQIPKKRSIENSSPPAIEPVSPTGSAHSAKTFTITPTEKLSHVLNIPTISEVKIDIIDENQCGDIEKKSPQISSYIVVDNRTADEQPEIIFNASKHIKRCKDNNKFPRKKPRKNKHVIKFKNVHFKYKNQKNNISRRLEKYYEKAKMNSPNAEQIQKQIYSNVLSKVVSRSRVLKKVLAKENLLDDTDRVSFYDGMSINEYDDGSLTSSPSTTKKSFVSYASQNTLVRNDSSSSRNEDFYSIKTINSVIQVSSDISPYKTDVINVAVAVAYSSSKPNNDHNTESDKLLCKQNLTSDETFLHPNTVLTSGPSSDDSNALNYVKINYDELNPINLNDKNLSDGTLTYEKQPIAGVKSSDDDTFVIARTSSDFNKSSINSDFTLTSNSDTTIQGESLPPNLLNNVEFMQPHIPKRATLLDTVINLGFYPEMTPSTSSGANFDSDVNDVVVSENLMKSLPLNPKYKGDDLPTDTTKLSNILKKSYDVEEMVCPQKNISLPNDVSIKSKLIEVEKGQRKLCSEEVRNKYPIDMSEMWDRLTLVLDLAVKRLEETLAEKIVKDIKTTLAILNKHEHKAPKLEIQQIETKHAPVKHDRQVPNMLHKEIFVFEDHLKVEADGCVQCDLVQNQVIDQLMLKLSVEGPKPMPASTESLKKLKRPQIVRDYFEILKPPAADSALIEVGRGDTVTVSTATAELVTEEFRGLNRLKLLISGPIAFIRENMFVLSSVPTFFIILLCLYGVIVIIMKPW